MQQSFKLAFLDLCEELHYLKIIKMQIMLFDLCVNLSMKLHHSVKNIMKICCFLWVSWYKLKEGDPTSL